MTKDDLKIIKKFDSALIPKIKKNVEDFFLMIPFNLEFNVSLKDEETVLVDVKTDEPQMLIGEGGQTLGDMQYVLKLFLKKKIQEPFHLDLDINNYKAQKDEYLRETALSVADEVSLTRKEKTLPIMTARERRVVHMALQAREDIATESVGEDPERRIVIKPRSF